MMAEQPGPLRRSRRAASLTAQLLWNIQIEDEDKATNNFVQKRTTPREEDESNKNEAIPAKRGRKRSAVAVTAVSKKESKMTECKILKTGNNNQAVFAVTKPLQIGKGTKIRGKLTASVAPLVKSQTAVQQNPVKTGSESGASPMSHSNQILLLPVALQSNQRSGHMTSGDVGSLPLLTLQGSVDFLQCFSLNNKADPGSNQWSTPGLLAPRNIPIGLNKKQLSYADPRRQRQQTHIDGSHAMNTVTQVEPLNLKMGETTVPSFEKVGSSNGKLTTVPDNKSYQTTIPRTVHISNVGHGADKAQSRTGKTSRNIKFTSSQNLKSPKGSNTPPLSASRSDNLLNNTKKKHMDKPPSPDYACSSPDVDDVQRDVKHRCNRSQINLRHIAAPPPESREYNTFVEEQRRLLAAANRRLQRMKRVKASPKDSDEDRPISLPHPSSPEEANNGWKWSGDAYSSLVFSVGSNKYVRRCCYPAMKRNDEEGVVVVMVKDCVLLLAGGSNELSYVAKVTALWEKAETKEMMMSLVWYYRPEHTANSEQYVGKVSEDELFASRHQDEMSVACVEERCPVLTYRQYCRIQARLRHDGLWSQDDARNSVAPLPREDKPSRIRRRIPNEIQPDPNDMFFCREMYDVKLKRLLKVLPPPTSLCPEHRRTASVTT